MDFLYCPYMQSLAMLFDESRISSQLFNILYIESFLYVENIIGKHRGGE